MALFRRSLRQFEESKFGLLLSLLSNVFLCGGEADRHIWKPRPSGVFSLKSFLRELEAVLGAKSLVSLAWLGSASPRVEVLSWLADFAFWKGLYYR